MCGTDSVQICVLLTECTGMCDTYRVYRYVWYLQSVQACVILQSVQVCVILTECTDMWYLQCTGMCVTYRVYKYVILTECTGMCDTYRVYRCDFDTWTCCWLCCRRWAKWRRCWRLTMMETCGWRLMGYGGWWVRSVAHWYMTHTDSHRNLPPKRPSLLSAKWVTILLWLKYQYCYSQQAPVCCAKLMFCCFCCLALLKPVSFYLVESPVFNELYVYLPK